MAINKKQFEKSLNFQVRRRVNNKFSSKTRVAGEAIKQRIRNLILDRLRDSNVYEAMRDELVGPLGFVDGQEKLETITDFWASEVVVNFVQLRESDLKRGGSGRFVKGGGLRILALDLDFSEILSLPEAIFDTPERGYELHWLDWLLTKGVGVIAEVDPYGFYKKVAGRTGEGIMIKGKEIQKFTIDPEFAGTVNDNFLTRLIDSISTQELNDIIAQEVIRII